MAGGRPVYMPPVEDIYYRGAALQWMKQQDWDPRIVDSVLLHDHPQISVVEWLVYHRGADTALVILTRLILE